MNAPKPYPLEWPLGWKRTDPNERKAAAFLHQKVAVTLTVGVQRVMDELRRVYASHVVISTDIQLRVDGRRVEKRATDPGVAVYWADGITDEQRMMAADIYTRTEDNLCAIAATLDAMRAIERHGGAQINKRAWAGFKALPSSTLPVFTTVQAAEALCRVAGFNTKHAADVLRDPEKFKEIVRLARAKAHPDKNAGNEADFLLVNECKRVLEAALGVTL